MARVAVEVGLRSPARCSGLKDPALLQLWLGSDPRPGYFQMLWVQPKKIIIIIKIKNKIKMPVIKTSLSFLYRQREILLCVPPLREAEM